MMHDVVRFVHEPECDLRDYELSTCRACEGLRAAYRRGRRLAAKDMLKASWYTPRVSASDLMVLFRAARGGEQE